MKALAIIAISLACTACASSDQRTSADQHARRNAVAMAQMNAEDDAYCKRYVEKAYLDCRNKLTEIRTANGIVTQPNQGAEPRRVTTTNCMPTTTGVTCN